MTDDEQLHGALADALHALVNDIEPSTQLRDWVKTELRSEPGPTQQPKPTQRRPRRWVLAFLTPTTAAAVAIVGLLLIGTSATPSFAVARIPGGLVRITLNDIEGVAGANTKLRQLGVESIVVVPVEPGCKNRVQLLFTGIGVHKRSAKISINPSQIPPHMVDVLAAKQIAPGILALGIGRVRGLAPSCVAPVKSGVGIPGPKSAP